MRCRYCFPGPHESCGPTSRNLPTRGRSYDQACPEFSRLVHFISFSRPNDFIHSDILIITICNSVSLQLLQLSFAMPITFSEIVLKDPFVLSISSLVIASIFLYCFNFRNRDTSSLSSPVSHPEISESAKQLVKTLVSALPDEVVLPADVAKFARAKDVYWDQQEADRIPSCIVQPRSVESLSIAVKILKCAFDERPGLHFRNGVEPGSRSAGLFAVRSGGHSPVSGAASMDGGVVIDLSKFNNITLSEDEKSIDVGSGCRWGAISRLLDARGLAVVGGRNSHVGVGGLLLAGGISFFSPQYGFAANNVLAYELVLADGSIVVASQDSYPDLWRALKGGSNNFGIVTRFTLRTVPSEKIWGGWLYYPSFQTSKVLAGIHDVLRKPMDEHAAGPLVSFTYTQAIGIEVISMNLIYTKAVTSWPACFTVFKSLWRFWSTCRPHSVTDAGDEMETLAPPRLRQAYGTTTITNDPETIAKTHAIYKDGIEAVKKIKGGMWTMVFQPLHPTWLRKGQPNPMGLQDCPDEPLLLVSYTVSWHKAEDDGLMHKEVRKGIERIERFTKERGTGYPYKFHNYCGDWQDPFEGYGKLGKQYLQDMSRRYDPDGLFQKGCVGGFKLGLNGENEQVKE